MEKTLLMFFLSVFVFQSICAHPLAGKFSKKALDYTNQFRKEKGLSTVSWDQNLADIAMTHSTNMATGKVPWGHEGFNERVAMIFEGEYCSVGENLFMSNQQGDMAFHAVDGWISSPGHCKNLLGDFDVCGIGVCNDEEGFWYFTQIFALSE